MIHTGERTLENAFEKIQHSALTGHRRDNISPRSNFVLQFGVWTIISTVSGFTMAIILSGGTDDC